MLGFFLLALPLSGSVKFVLFLFLSLAYVSPEISPVTLLAGPFLSWVRNVHPIKNKLNFFFPSERVILTFLLRLYHLGYVM